jgi:hypothetical protein
VTCPRIFGPTRTADYCEEVDGALRPSRLRSSNFPDRQGRLKPVTAEPSRHPARSRRKQSFKCLRTSCGTTHETTSLELLCTFLPKAEPRKWPLKTDLLPTDQHSGDTRETKFVGRKSRAALHCLLATLDHRRQGLDQRPHETLGVADRLVAQRSTQTPEMCSLAILAALSKAHLRGSRFNSTGV